VRPTVFIIAVALLSGCDSSIEAFSLSRRLMGVTCFRWLPNCKQQTIRRRGGSTSAFASRVRARRLVAASPALRVMSQSRSHGRVRLKFASACLLSYYGVLSSHLLQRGTE